MRIFVNTVELRETLPGDEGAGPVLVPVSSSRTALAFILSSALMLSLPARRYYWERPWEVKELVVGSVRSVFGRAKPAEEQLPYHLESVFIQVSAAIRGAPRRVRP